MMVFSQDECDNLYCQYERGHCCRNFNLVRKTEAGQNNRESGMEVSRYESQADRSRDPLGGYSLGSLLLFGA